MLGSAIVKQEIERERETLVDKTHLISLLTILLTPTRSQTNVLIDDDVMCCYGNESKNCNLIGQILVLAFETKQIPVLYYLMS